jgi:hypothetical protein
LGFGWVSIGFCVLVRLVNARLIQSFMVGHFLLFYTFCAGAFSAD